MRAVLMVAVLVLSALASGPVVRWFHWELRDGDRLTKECYFWGAWGSVQDVRYLQVFRYNCHAPGHRACVYEVVNMPPAYPATVSPQQCEAPDTHRFHAGAVTIRNRDWGGRAAATCAIALFLFWIAWLLPERLKLWKARPSGPTQCPAQQGAAQGGT